MKRKIFLIFLGLILFINLSHAQVKRPYEPIVLKGDTLAQFINHEIQFMYVYAYDAIADSWQMIPFQIDEVNPHDQDSMYFKPDSSYGLLDEDDELVFLLREVGDKADSTSWVEGADSIRYEICLVDSLTNEMGYVYLYSSRTISDPVPNPYFMAYDSVTDRISTANYEAGFNETGQLSDVVIGNSGIDIFDRLKVRLMGSYWIFALDPIYEDNVSMNYAYAKVGPVRAIRNMYGKFYYSFAGVITFDEKFTQTSFFYPWMGSFTLFEIPIEDAVDAGVEVDVIRISWDFNRNAIGMNFYNEVNRSGTLINGVGGFDNIDRACSPGELNWTMGTGNPGTILNVFSVPAIGDQIQIYFYDDSTSGKSGDAYGKKFDSGDNDSFGDNGFSLEKNVENYAKDNPSLDVAYYNFFLPPNFNPDDASTICTQLKSPVSYFASAQKMPRPSEVAEADDLVPNKYALFQNYPNPFNSTTKISFSLPKRNDVSLKIYDSLGRLVATLVEGTLPQGVHRYTWQGLDQRGLPLATGMYFYKLETSEFNSTKKLLLIK